MQQIFEENWWAIVKELAVLINLHKDTEEEVDDDEIRLDLLMRGYREDDIVRAYEWIDSASLSVNFSECIAMLTHQMESARVITNRERASLSPCLLNLLHKCRALAYISDEIFEGLVESAKQMGASDWDEQESLEYLIPVMETLNIGLSREAASRLLQASEKEFMS